MADESRAKAIKAVEAIFDRYVALLFELYGGCVPGCQSDMFPGIS
jgi:hypothetical protein